MKSDLIDLELILHYETERAILVSATSDKDEESVWLPKSKIEIERQDRYIVVTMPERLAIDKGLV